MGELASSAYYGNYSSVGDMIAIALCIVIFILIQTSYVSRTSTFILFIGILGVVFLAATSNLFLYMGLSSNDFLSIKAIYAVRFVFRLLLCLDLFFFLCYVMEVLKLDRGTMKRLVAVTGFVTVAFWVIDIAGMVKGFGFTVGSDRVADQGFDGFVYVYAIYVLAFAYIFVKYRGRLYKQIMIGLFGVIGISGVVFFIQLFHGQHSFTTAAFVFPLVAAFYLIHSNPYDIEIGALTASGFEDLITYDYKRKRDFMIISLYMREFDEEGKKFSKEIGSIMRAFSTNYFRESFMFKVGNGHVILCVNLEKNPDYENRLNHILNDFEETYKKFRYDYKMVVGKSIDEISRRNEYVSFVRNIHKHMDYNEVHFISFDDLMAFNKEKFILEELEDIYKQKDLDDPRVRVYCQPVYNIKTGRYDTAEALMRLQLPEIGLVFPDQFISLAEECGYIHVLSMIMMHKTCSQIRKMILAGYDVKRISINISVLEMREDSFCSDINGIIKETGIPDEKVAIEITESQNESDYYIMRDKINELKEHGIKFYLDDFGTGYSNIERIMELPFDIIKFDRSLVIASGEDQKSEKMVGNLARMFSDMEYSVLYEGVENDLDEKKCIDMYASYLQGYKYSRPIPIEGLYDFFEKDELK